MLPSKSVWDKMSKEEQFCWRHTMEELKGMCREKGISGYSERTLMREPMKEYDEEKGKLYRPYPDYKTELIKLCCLETIKSPVTRKTPTPKPIVEDFSPRALEENREMMYDFLSDDEWRKMVRDDLLKERPKGAWGYRLFCKKKGEPTRILPYDRSTKGGKVGRFDLNCGHGEKRGIVYYDDEIEDKPLADEMIRPGFYSLFMMRSGGHNRSFGCRAFDKEKPKLFCIMSADPSEASRKRLYQKLRRIKTTPDSTRDDYEEAFKPMYEVIKDFL